MSSLDRISLNEGIDLMSLARSELVSILTLTNAVLVMSGMKSVSETSCSSIGPINSG